MALPSKLIFISGLLMTFVLFEGGPNIKDLNYLELIIQLELWNPPLQHLQACPSSKFLFSFVNFDIQLAPNAQKYSI